MFEGHTLFLIVSTNQFIIDISRQLVKLLNGKSRKLLSCGRTRVGQSCEDVTGRNQRRAR
jgi:hypothetical protein